MGLKIRSILYALATYTTFTTYNYIETQRVIAERLEKFQKTGNDERFNTLTINGTFENPFTEYRPQTIYEFFIMRLLELTEIKIFDRSSGRGKGNVPNDIHERVQETGWIETNLNKLNDVFKDCLDNGKLSYIWLGQSCGLFTSGDKKFLLDPIFENFIVNSYIGPKRILPSPIDLDDMKDIIKPNYILISHDHPDHLGDSTVQQLTGNNGIKWIVPIGLNKFLNNNGVPNDQIVEMKWWDRTRLDDEFEVVCLPAMHWSGRKLYDSNTSLWCSFLILRNGKGLFYHGGDTGYAQEVFKKIGDLYGPIKLGALPIGQYCPEWHQSPRHISPSESIKIMNEMKIHKLIGVHWGTFVLSSEPYLEPGEKLKHESIKCGKENNIIVPNQGRIFVMDENKVDFLNDDEIEINDEEMIVYKTGKVGEQK